MISELTLKLTGRVMSLDSSVENVSTVTVDSLKLPMPEDFSIEMVRGIQTFKLAYTTPEACAAVVQALKKGQEPL